MTEFENIRSLALSGKTIEAIKRAKELCDIGLKESKDLVNALERGSITPAGAQIHYFKGNQEHSTKTRDSYGSQHYDAVYSYITSGKKLQAIKELKDITTLGLKDCKDLVDAIETNALSPEELSQKIASIESSKQHNITDANTATSNLIIKEKSNILVYIAIALAVLIIGYFLVKR